MTDEILDKANTIKNAIGQLESKIKTLENSEGDIEIGNSNDLILGSLVFTQQGLNLEIIKIVKKEISLLNKLFKTL